MFQSYWANEYIGEKLFCSVLWKFSVELMEDFPQNLPKLSMESTAYFRKIYGNIPWN